jgi:hypothetical protein
MTDRAMSPLRRRMISCQRRTGENVRREWSANIPGVLRKKL